MAEGSRPNSKGSVLQRGFPYRHLECQFECQVRRSKSEAFIEAMSIFSGLVAGQLDQGKIPPTALLEGPFQHLRAKTIAAQPLIYPDSHGQSCRAYRASQGITVSCMVATTASAS